MTIPPLQNSSISASRPVLSRLQGFFLGDGKLHEKSPVNRNIILGGLTIFIIGASAFVFYYYLYKALFDPLGHVSFVPPRVDQALLQKAVQQSTLQQNVLNTPFQETTRDPFQ